MRKFVSLVAVAAAACAVVVALATDAPARRPGTSYTVLQMNLCLSGISGCYPRTAYPDVLDEAAAQVVDHEPQVVTLNEACSGDARAMADRTGYHLRFATVSYGAGALSCVKPGGRGVFGIAVLTKAPIVSSRDRAFSSAGGLRGTALGVRHHHARRDRMHRAPEHPWHGTRATGQRRRVPRAAWCPGAVRRGRHDRLRR